MHWHRFLLVFSILITCATGTAAQTRDELKVIFLAGESWFGKQGYRYSLLDLALAKSGRSYSLTVADDNLPQKRRSAIMEKSSQPYIMIMGTNPKLETQHRAIYFPIYLGIGSGYRLFLARKDLQDRLRAVRNLKDLQNFSIVQGMHWSDVAILRNAGLEIQEVARKSLLWKMTEIGRYDLFPRGMFEIFEEHANYKKQLPNLIVDDHLLITYPFAIYYFVNKDNDELAAAIEAGLRAAYHGGELQDLLFKTIGPNVKKALKEIKNRVRIDLPAHNISPQTLEVIKKYPFDFSRIEN